MKSYICRINGMHINCLKVLAVLFAVSTFSVACAQNPVKKSFPNDLLFKVAFWNVENLMDTIDDPGNDNDFTPQGAMEWNTSKLDNKLNNLEKVIYAMHPDIMGFCEVEHEALLKMLVSRDSLKQIPYGIVHFESPDERGIDVALIYNRNKMFVLKSEALPVLLPGNDATRDILYVRFLIKTQRDTLNVFVNHWPSRREGRERSETKRMAAADTLYHYLKKHRLLAEKTILLGDFNDDPNDASLRTGLHATTPGATGVAPDYVYNLGNLVSTDTAGSLKYNNHWNLFDQVLVSPVLWPAMQGVQLKYHPQSFGIFAPDWMKQHDTKYEGYPLRTFGGKNWLNGYSDHFPVFAELRYE